MSERLKSFALLSGTPPDPKSKLDILAAAAGLDPFPDSSDPLTYGAATAWDAAKADYATDAIVWGPDGGYYRCLTTPPAGTFLSHTTYWTTCTPDWVPYMNRVRHAVRDLLFGAAGEVVDGFAPAGDASVRAALIESAVLSGPWDVTAHAGAGLGLTQPLATKDSAGTYCTPACYAFADVDLYSESAGARLDVRGSGPAPYHCTATDPPVFRLKATFTEGYVSGTVSVNIPDTGGVNPDPDCGGTWDGTLGLMTWSWDGDLLTEIDLTCHGPSGGGVMTISEYDVDLLWPGSTAVVATNVLSEVDVYRSRAQAPRVVSYGFTVVDGEVSAGAPLADGANLVGFTAFPMEVVDDVAVDLAGSQWRLRARTLPVSDVSYAEELALTTDMAWQRQGFVCQRATDTRVIVPSTAQQHIRELDTIWGKRKGTAVDQLRPVLDRTATAVSRPVVTATVGYLRSGDTSLTRVFSGAALSVPADRMEQEKYLGRANALLVWSNSAESPMPLRWDGAGVYVAATGPVSAWVPNAADDWSWTHGGGAVAVGYFFDAAAHYDDLLAVLALVGV